MGDVNLSFGRSRGVSKTRKPYLQCGNWLPLEVYAVTIDHGDGFI